MLEKIISDYYTFFDETLHSGTLVVLIIAFLIFSVGAIIPVANADISYMKGSALEVSNLGSNINTVVIDGKKYEVIFSKID